MNNKIFLIRQFDFFKKRKQQGYKLMIQVYENKPKYFKVILYTNSFRILPIDSLNFCKDELEINPNHLPRNIRLILSKYLDLSIIAYYKFCYDKSWKDFLFKDLYSKKFIAQNLDITIELIEELGSFKTFKKVSSNTYHINDIEVVINSSESDQKSIKTLKPLYIVHNEEKKFGTAVNHFSKTLICTQLHLSFDDIKLFFKETPNTQKIENCLEILKDAPKPNKDQISYLRSDHIYRVIAIEELIGDNYPIDYQDKIRLSRIMAKILASPNR